MRLDPVGQRVEQRPARLGRGQVHEQEPAVGLRTDAEQRMLRAIEALVLVDVGRPDEPSVEVVRPGVVRALEDLVDVAAARLVVEELGATVGTHVVERADLAGVVAREHDRLAGEVAHEVVPGSRDLLGPADADPVAEPDALALVRPGRLGRVVRAGQGRAGAPGRCSGRRQRARLGGHRGVG